MLMTAACNRDDYRGLTDQEKIGAGQTPAGTEADGTTANSAEFAQKAASANAAEIRLGELARQRAESRKVKDYAEMMVNDHTKANQELMTAAGGQSLNTELDDKHRQIFDRLSSLQGKEFDREYMKAMVQGHQDVADMLERRTSASQGRGQGDQTSGLDQWAQRTLPTVRTHLEQARQISDSL
jgi:putative membrane protein